MIPMNMILIRFACIKNSIGKHSLLSSYVILTLFHPQNKSLFSDRFPLIHIMYTQLF